MVCEPLAGYHESLPREGGRRLSEKSGGLSEIRRQKGRGSKVQQWRRTAGRRTRTEVKEQNRHHTDNETQNTKRSPNAKSQDHLFNTPKLQADWHGSDLRGIWEVFARDSITFRLPTRRPRHFSSRLYVFLTFFRLFVSLDPDPVCWIH